jgi:hypothetical protein
VFVRELEQRRHFGALAVQMHRHECAHAPAGDAIDQLATATITVLRNKTAHCIGLQIVRNGIYITEYRPCTGPRDGAGRGKKRVRRRDHLIAGADTKGHEGQQQRVRT